jgi:hypothetical protein
MHFYIIHRASKVANPLCRMRIHIHITIFFKFFNKYYRLEGCVTPTEAYMSKRVLVNTRPTNKTSQISANVFWRRSP